MDTIQGTDIGQVNCSPNSQTGFAAVNPPMNPLRAGRTRPHTAEIPPDGDLPQAWPVSAVQPTSNYTVADVVNGLLSEPEREWSAKDQPICGVVTIRVPNRWSPKSVRSVPPSLTNKLGMYLSAQWAMLFNGSDYARRKNRWALVTTRGPVLILTGVGLKDRPVNPSDFPVCVTAGLTTYEADQFAIDANEPRCRFAHVPKEWAIPVRRADSVEFEGGDA